MSTVRIVSVSAEHHHSGLGLFTPTPRLSWRFSSTDAVNWRQESYDIVIKTGAKGEEYHVDSPDSVLVPWPGTPLRSRDRVQVSVRAKGTDGHFTEWASLAVEVALLEREHWKAALVGGPAQGPEPKRPILLRKTFKVASSSPARLYATAHGVYEVEINGKRVGDEVMAPGWNAYNHRLCYQTHDISSYLKEGENVIGVHLAEGWFAGRLGRPGVPNHWGERLGFLGQVEVGGEIVCMTDTTWEYLDGPLLLSEIYNGESCDSTLIDPEWSTVGASSQAQGKVEVLPFPKAELVAPDVSPIRRIMEVKAKEIITTPSGKKVIDFGQNLVGWLRIDKELPGPGELLIRHAEVLEHGELATRPLRSANAQYTVKLGGPTKGLETKFTFYGFRYAEINGVDFGLDTFTAVVISSDMQRTGSFESSHAALNRLHENTVWSMRGNFIGVPTDCPQRDERLGWTGDIQVFCPTASFLYDTSAFLSSWLRDLEHDQRDANGVVPIIVPNLPAQPDERMVRPMAVWADSCIMTPWDLYNAYGDAGILEKQWESMKLWLDKGVPRDDRGMYSTRQAQYSDWLDPRSPPETPGNSPTDSFFVANAYLIHSTELAAKIGKILGKPEAETYAADAERLRELFLQEYVTPNGRMACDTQTCYALALRFGLLRDEKQIATAQARLNHLVRWELFRITTGFAGTPIILQTLADNGMLTLAYRMIQERDCPSWLYPVQMGATTIWERWNSMLEDGSVNPGEMTSFNHYALGSVCDFLHSFVGGLSPAEPGWKRALVKPQPGGTVRSAKTSFDSPYGLYEVEWAIKDGEMQTRVGVPPNGEARVVLSGVDEVVGSGEHTYKTPWKDDEDWPPAYIPGPQKNTIDSVFVP